MDHIGAVDRVNLTRSSPNFEYGGSKCVPLRVPLPDCQLLPV